MLGRLAGLRGLCSGRTVAVDTSGLLGRRAPPHGFHGHHRFDGLMRELAGRIRFRGPLTVAEYMGLANTHPEHGYYMRRDVFGRQGDFITSPEVSQVFGELVGIWCVACWEAMGRPPRFRLVEAGPGRGTLMADLLRATMPFRGFHDALASVHLVEVSPFNRETQREALSHLVSDGRLHWHSDLAELRGTAGTAARAGAAGEGAGSVCVGAGEPTGGDGSEADGSALPESAEPSLALSAETLPPLLLIAHEFLDALPVHQVVLAAPPRPPLPRARTSATYRTHGLSSPHAPLPPAQFVRTPVGWREKLIDLRAHVPAPADTATTAASCVAPASPGAEPGEAEAAAGRSLDSDSRDLDFVLSPSPTPATNLFTRQLSAHADAAEVCPVGLAFAQEVCAQIGAAGGAALFVDYGADSTPADSVRGIRDHRFVHPLHAPGETDLSADVDFGALRAVARAAPGALTCPPFVAQRHFLAAMGLEARVNQLLRAAPNDAARRAIVAGASRLVEDPGMGTAYKALSIAHPSLGNRVPGFAPA